MCVCDPVCVCVCVCVCVVGCSKKVTEVSQGIQGQGVPLAIMRDGVENGQSLGIRAASPPLLSPTLPPHSFPSGVDAVLYCPDPHSEIKDLFSQLLGVLTEDGSLLSAFFGDCLG